MTWPTIKVALMTIVFTCLLVLSMGEAAFG
jgi:hypothetical protein